MKMKPDIAEPERCVRTLSLPEFERECKTRKSRYFCLYYLNFRASAQSEILVYVQRPLETLFTCDTHTEELS